jgi:DNA-binding LacI/PurR family transcriptional regulator
MITRRSRLVGLVFPGQMPPIYSLALAHFCQRLHQAGYQTLIITAENFSNADEAVRSLLRLPDRRSGGGIGDLVLAAAGNVRNRACR